MLVACALAASLTATGSSAEATTVTNETPAQLDRDLGMLGGAVADRGDLRQPLDVAAAPYGDVAAVDGSRVVRYDPTGEVVWVIDGQRPAGATPRFQSAEALAFSPAGHLYVSAVVAGGAKVLHFDAAGTFVSSWSYHALALATDANGDVWATGPSCQFARFTAAGTLASSFGNCSGPVTNSALNGLAVAADGSLFVESGDVISHLSSTGAVLARFGGTGDDAGKFHDAYSLDIAADGSVYVTDINGAQVEHFSSAGQHLGAFGTRGTNPGQFVAPHGVAVGSDGDLYVTDNTDNARSISVVHPLQRFDGTGVLVDAGPSVGDGRGWFQYPRDVATTPDGGLVVADTHNHRILRAGADEVFDTAWGSEGSGPGQFRYPKAVAVAANGDVYVADTFNDRVQRLSPTGAFLGAWGTSGAGTGQFNRPAGIDIGPDDDVWVADSGNNRIQRFTSTGAFVAAHGTAGTGVGQFARPSAIAVGAEGIFVFDAGNRRVQRLELDGSPGDAWEVRKPGLAPNDIDEGGVAVDPLGGVWVATSAFFSSRGLWHFTAHGDALSYQPLGGAMYGLAVHDDRTLFVASASGLAMFQPATGPLMTVELAAAHPTAEVGRSVDLRLRVHNSGAVPLTGLQATYTRTAECNGALPDVPPGGTLERTCAHTATVADMGQYADMVRVTAAEIPAGLQSGLLDAAVSVLSPAPRLLGTLGGPGTNPGQLQSSQDIDVGPDGDVYVANRSSTGHEVDVFHDAQPVRTVALTPSITTSRLAAGANGDLFQLTSFGVPYQPPYGEPTYIAASDVRRYAADGTPLGAVDGSYGDDDAPVDIDARADGHVLKLTRSQVAYYAGYNFTNPVYVGSDAIVDLVPSAGTSSFVPVSTQPTSVASTTTDRYLLYSSSSGGTVTHDVRRRAADPASFGVPGPSAASDLDVDAAGNVYVLYGGAGEVRVFTPAGTWVAGWSASGDRISLGQDGLIYVLDRTASVVRVFGFGISGVVADEVSDAPITGAVAVAVNAVGQVAGAAMSDGSGRYRLRVGQGQYRVLFLDPSGAHLGEWAWGHAVGDVDAAAAVSVGVTGRTVDIGLLPARGSVAGSVSADGGGAVAGAWVASIARGSGAMRGAVAGGDGAYSIPAVDPGGHLVVFVDPSGQRRFEFFDDKAYAPFADPVTVSAGAVSTASAGLPAQGPFEGGSTIVGSVTDDDAGGAPVQGAWVVAVRSDGVVRAGAVTDAAGHYSLAVGPGSYRVQVLDPLGAHTGQWVPDRGLDDYDGADVVSVGAGDHATVDAGLASNRGSIAGRVTDPTGGTAGAVVLAISLSSGQVAGAATAAGDGAYAIDGLVPGDYLVAFLDSWGDHGYEYFDDTANPGAATPVAVTAGQSTSIDGELDS